MSNERWKELLGEAYSADPYSRSIMNSFNERVADLKEQGVPVETDPEANRLYAGLVLAVRAFLEGKPIRFNQEMVAQ